MLDLSVPGRTVAGVDLAGDDRDPFAWYILPPAPRVALDEKGAPRLALLRFISGGKLVGGHLYFQVELAHPPSLLDQVKQQLSAILKDDKQRVSLQPLVVEAATAELQFVGNETASDGGVGPLLRRAYGVTSPLLDPPYTASFSVMLTVEGATLVEAALRSGGAPIGVSYRLTSEGLRPAQQIIARIDWGRAYDHLSSEVKEGALFAVEDIRHLTEKLVEQKIVDIRVVQALVADENTPVPDIGPALSWVQREIVEKCCIPVQPLSREPARASLGDVGEMFGVGTDYALKAISQVERATAEIDYQTSAVTTRTLAVSAHLADLLGGAPVAEHIADALDNDPFFATFTLHVTTARPLAASFAAEVVAHFLYGSVNLALPINADHADVNFTAFADQSPDRSWKLPLDVTLRDDAPMDPGLVLHLDGPSGTGREAALDLDRILGLRRVDVTGSSDARILATRVEIQQTRGAGPVGQPQQLTLLPAKPTATAWFRDVQPGDRLLATTHHLLTDHRLIEVAPIPVETQAFRLPPPFPGTMTVQVFVDDDWSDLDQLVLGLQKSADLPAGTFSFTKASPPFAVNLDLPDPLDRTYRYKITFTDKAGDLHEGDWQTTDSSTLLAAPIASDKLVVDVTPMGVEPPLAGISLIEVQLQYVDAAHQIRVVQTALIRALSDRYHWDVSIQDPQRRSYDYQVTTHHSDGATQVGPWITTSDRILIVPVVKAA